jgi:hypothetical protein
MSESRRTVYPKAGAYVPGVPAVPTITDRGTARRLLLSGAFESRERAQEDLDAVDLPDHARAALDLAIPDPASLRSRAAALADDADAADDPGRADRLRGRAAHLTRAAEAQDELLGDATPEPDAKPAPATEPPNPDQPAAAPATEPQE